MTEAEVFECGFWHGVMAHAEAEDDVLSIAVEYAVRVAWAAEREDAPELRARAVELDRRILAARARTRRVANRGPALAWAIESVERSMEVTR